jgi:hypothetical protein
MFCFSLSESIISIMKVYSFLSTSWIVFSIFSRISFLEQQTGTSPSPYGDGEPPSVITS